jgi:hypothetical protein
MGVVSIELFLNNLFPLWYCLVVNFVQDIGSFFTGARRSSRITPIRVGIADQEFIDRCFPYPHQAPLRDQLADILQQPWLRFNYEEPPHALRSLLAETDSGNLECKICSRILRRGARALEHIRIHLDHTPFKCLGSSVGCSQPNWCVDFHLYLAWLCSQTPYAALHFLYSERVFPGRESMRDHQRKAQIQCHQWLV